MTATPAFAVGDRVYVDDPSTPGIWRVDRRLPKNYRLTQGGRVCRAAPVLMRPVGDELVTAANGALVGIVPFDEPLTIGETVKLRGREGVYVVIKETRDSYHVARLGGEGGRYYRAMRQLLTPIELEWTEK